jgi:alanine racemase
MISARAFDHNAKVVRSFVDSKAIIAFVVKANGYGHGLKQVCYLAQNNDLINWFCVFHLSEAVSIRSHGFKKPILVMGDWDYDVTAFADCTIVPMVDSIDAVILLNKLGKLHNKKLPIHLKIDTGLSRFGLFEHGIDFFLDLLKEYPWVFVQGLYTHFAQSQLEDQSYTDLQEKIFDLAIKRVTNILGPIAYIHAYNSASTMIRHTNRYNFFRIGLALYGYYSSDFTRLQAGKKGKSSNPLRPILTLQSYIMNIKHVLKGSLIGYNCTFQATNDMKIGLVPFGYFDGYEPAFFQKAYAIIDGQKIAVIGRIAMNLIVVDITDCKDISIQTKVLLIDPVLCPADELCDSAGISNVRTFFSRLNPAIERKIVQN